MYESIGKLRIFTKWALLECDDQIGAMYRALYALEYFYKPKIHKPLWGSHISIIRGEKELYEPTKLEIMNEDIEFLYIPEIQTNGIYFWLPVICPVLDDIRKLFGLDQSSVAYHLSIGNIRDETGWREPEIYI